MADVVEQEPLETLIDMDTAADKEDAGDIYLDDDDNMMIGKYERPPTRRALTHEEFEALVEFLKQPPSRSRPKPKG